MYLKALALIVEKSKLKISSGVISLAGSLGKNSIHKRSPPMTNHTPTPWHPHDMEQGIVCTEGGLPIVDTNAKALEQSERNANAAFICRAVNAHEELLAMLKHEHDKLIEIDEAEHGDTCPVCDVIAKAEGK